MYACTLSILGAVLALGVANPLTDNRMAGTVKCDMYRAEVGGVKFALIDTPGMQTGSATIDTTLAPIKQFLDKNPLVKIHGILFTTPAPNTRTFGFEVVPLFILRAICGKPFSNLTVVVTNGDVVSPALLKSRLYEWRRTVARWTPGCKVRAFDRGNPGGMLSHYSGMKRKGILENKAPLLVTELRGHQPEPALTTAGKAAVDGKKWRGDLRDREAWARKLRGWVADARYSNPPRPNARSQPHS